MKYITGDLFSYPICPDKHTYICHVVNNIGVFGAGFVIPLGKKYPPAKAEYIADYSDFSLGENQYVKISPRLIVVNIFAQDGVSNYAKANNVKPFQYGYFAECLCDLKEVYLNNGFEPEKYEVLMPLVGAGLGGGNWDIIEEIIENILGKFDVKIFQLAGQEVR